MVTSINSAVTASPARTSANIERMRSSAFCGRPETWVEPAIGCLVVAGSWAAPLPPAHNASARVETRKRRHRGDDFDRLFGSERAGELRQMALPPVLRAFVVPAPAAAGAVEEHQHVLGGAWTV